MILCQKCRGEIPNPDATTFNLDMRVIVNPDNTTVPLCPSDFRILTSLIAAGVGKTAKKQVIMNDVFSRPINNPANSLRESIRCMRRKLAQTPWTIITRHGHGYSLAKRNAAAALKGAPPL